MEKRKLVIAISGCTGTGKTKLGIELAKKHNGEVISADSMQIYEGLDIISNTVTEEEADGVRHHCISYVSPDEQYNVIRYIEHTLPIVEDIFERGKTPIIVGGTAYYVEALLWEFTLYDHSSQIQCGKTEISDSSVKILQSELLSDYEKLQKLDPIHAQTLHPNDSRKINRSLEIYREYGTCHSTLLDQQHQGCNDIRGKLRWDGALLFSIESDQKVLDVRLDRRVDKMIELGLCSELDEFSEKYQNVDSGLLSQVIGFKEFESYIRLKQSKNIDLECLENALSEGIEKMKIVTRRYSRKQIRWIKNRLERDDVCPNYYFIRLDSTFPEQWQHVISEPVNHAVNQFFSGTLQKSYSVSTPARPQKIAKKCQDCGVTCVGDESFSVHLKSRKHKRKKAYNSSKPIIEQRIAAKKNSLSRDASK